MNEKQGILHINDWISYSIPENFTQISFDSIINRKKQNASENNQIHIYIKENPDQQILVQPKVSLVDEIFRFWNKISLGKYHYEMPIKQFLIQTTNLFYSSGIPKEQLFKYLTQTLVTSIPGFITFNDFSRLISNFGEKLTIGPKMMLLIEQVGHLFKPQIYSIELSNVSNNEDISIIYSNGSNYGFVLYGKGKSIGITNDFNIPFFNNYLVTNDSRFSSWISLISYYFPDYS